MTHFVGSDRGVNPVIGIVLLIGVAVILSAAIGTFLIGLGSDIGGGAQAAVETSTVETHDSDGFVTISGISMQRAQRISVEATIANGDSGLNDGDGNGTAQVTETIDSADESVTFQQHSGYSGDVNVELVAVAHNNDDSSIILDREVTI